MNISDMFIDLFVIFKSWLDVLPINFIECSIFNLTLTRNNLSGPKFWVLDQSVLVRGSLIRTYVNKHGHVRMDETDLPDIACTIFP